jgi:Protein of unknown function (DUF2505)
MHSFTLSHEIQCDEETFWKIFFDKDFNAALYKEGLAFPDYSVLELKESDKEIFRRVKVTPKMDAPAPVAKVLGSSFSYVEEGTFDRAAKIYRWKSIPSQMAEKVKTDGDVRAQPAGDGKVTRLSKFNYEAKIFAIGGLVESSIEKSLRSGWDKSAVFFNDWLKKRG